MPEAAFRELCLDASDPHALAAFWAAALHRTLDTDERAARLLGPDGRRDGSLTWIDPVPEPRTAKTRVHVDLRLPAADPAPLVALGATVISEPEGDRHWWVLEDPEGNVFCAMPPAAPERGLPAVEVPTPFELVVDSADPETIATWWAARLGGRALTEAGAPYWWVEGAAGFPWPDWIFIEVPEPKTAKNRMHWDVDLDGEDPAPLLAAGARLLREPDAEIGWWVLADPEGNEFCAFPRSAPA